MSSHDQPAGRDGVYRVRFAAAPRVDDSVTHALRRAYHPADAVPADMTDLLARLR